MNLNVPTHIREAMRLMKAGDLHGATAILRGGVAEASPAPAASSARGYKLFVPTLTGIEPRPLVVMLHGCTQDPDDFARGTRMNRLAQEHGCYVLYPAQSPAANAQKCWNWFRAGDQRRGQGEPALIAALVDDVAAAHEIDRRRIYVAGMSAGGAMAVILGATYPELFAAVGVHSGLPYAAAHDLPSALQAMKAAVPGCGAGQVAPALPTIVFHGDADAVVDPCNGQHVAAASVEHSRFEGVEEVQVEGATQGRRYTRTDFRAADGSVIAEHWRIHGGGHRWSGGDPSGSHTDANGPDASREMLRFFLARARAADR